MIPWLIRAAEMHPERLALVTEDERLTYAELEARARRTAGALAEKGIKPGDRVALALPAGAEFCVALHACALMGATAVPVDLRLTAAERQARLGGATVVVEERLDGPPLDAIHRPEADEVAALMHTSGTTGAPKPVPLTYGNWLASALGSAAVLGLDLRERWLCPLPLAHVGGLSVLIRSSIYATTAVVHERFEPDAMLAALNDTVEAPTMVSLVATMLERLLDAGLRDPPELRWALLGGGPIPQNLLDRALDARVSVAPTYGMTEACSQIVTRGWPLPGTEVEISERGEVLVRGPAVSPAVIAEDGWLHTGDRGALDEHGRLTLTGRLSELIVSGGENVAPLEVEEVLRSHPAVADVAVHGRPDPEWGEAVVASVIVRDGAALDPAELRAHCARELARFKIPKAFEFVERLPRTESGKLLRRQLGTSSHHPT
jgi:O-succinylbenzoic acid--CoA ligase